MERTPALVEIHYALWGVLALPFGFAGVFFIIGLLFVEAVTLLVISGLFIIYVSKLSQRVRLAWLLGALAHAGLLVGAFYYIPRWPGLLAIPLALLNLYSLTVLVLYRRIWATPSSRAQTQALVA